MRGSGGVQCRAISVQGSSKSAEYTHMYSSGPHTMDTHTLHTKPTVEGKTQQKKNKREEKKDGNREGKQ